MHEYVQKSRSTTLPAQPRDRERRCVEPLLDGREVGRRTVVVEALLPGEPGRPDELLELRLRRGALLERLQRLRVLGNTRPQVAVNAVDHQDGDNEDADSEGTPHERGVGANGLEAHPVLGPDRDPEEDEAGPQAVGEGDEDCLEPEVPVAARSRRRRSPGRRRA